MTALLTSILALLLVTTNKHAVQGFLFPRVVPDSRYKQTHPLPPGDVSGCPYFSSIASIVLPNLNKWYSEQYDKVTSSSSPSLFKSFFLFQPATVIVGSSPSRDILNKEFLEDGVAQPIDGGFGNAYEIFGKNSISTETKDKSKHRFLRSLVGKAMTHEAVAEGIGGLQQASESVIGDKILADAKTYDLVEMEKHLKYFTLGEFMYYNALFHEPILPLLIILTYHRMY